MSVNLRFSFKMDLADISTIDFAFAETYADLETNPFLEKSYPEVGTLQNKAIVIPLSDEEAEELPTQFYALSTVNFKNGSTVKAHAFKNTAKEEALSALLMTDNTEYNINFFIDETNGGGGGVDAYINGVKLEGYKTAAELDLVKASENIKIWDAVLDDNDEISHNPEDYPGIKEEDIAIYMTPYSQVKMWMQAHAPDVDTVYWVSVDTDEVRYAKGVSEPPSTCSYPERYRYDIGQIYLQNQGDGLYILVKDEFISYNSGYKLFWKKILLADDNYMLIPKPTIADAGKVLKVNASGEPEWVAE